jgi:2-polyprenyl-3-methyl-5-hydroxy-6-metoxy-1,4-benzoquinol methylase
MNMQGRKVLDIGANAGFFSYQFAKLGAVVDALEPHKPYYDLGVAVVAHYGVSVSWFNEPLCERFLEHRYYEIALMLSVFQWISEGNAQLKRACELLRLVLCQL